MYDFEQIRKLEVVIATLLLLMAACFFGEMGYVKPPASQVLEGMFIPKLKGQGATAEVIALLGAIISPYDSITSLSLALKYLFFLKPI